MFDDAWVAWEDQLERTGQAVEELVAAFRIVLPFYFAEPEDQVSVAHIERIRRELRWHPPICDAWAGEREAADHRGLLGGTRCPALVITGEHDWICGPTWNRALADAIPGSRYVVVPGVGHLPQYEAPAAFRTAIDDWLAG